MLQRHHTVQLIKCSMKTSWYTGDWWCELSVVFFMLKKCEWGNPISDKNRSRVWRNGYLKRYERDRLWWTWILSTYSCSYLNSFLLHRFILLWNGSGWSQIFYFFFASHWWNWRISLINNMWNLCNLFEFMLDTLHNNVRLT